MKFYIWDMCHCPPIWLETLITGNWGQFGPIGTIWDQFGTKFKNPLCTKRYHQNFLPNAIYRMKIRPTVPEISRGKDARTDARTDAQKKLVKIRAPKLRLVDGPILQKAET